MAVTAFAYGKGIQAIVKGSVDLDTDTFKAMLTTSAYTPDQDAHDFRDDVTNEIVGTGYTAGGVALTSLAVTYDAASNEVRWDFDDPSWSGATFTTRKLVVYKSRGGAASADELVFWIDFGADEVIAAGVFSVTIDATGALKLTVA